MVVAPNKIWVILIILTLVTPPIDISGIKLNYISSLMLSITVITLVLCNKIKLQKLELSYFFFFIIYITSSMVIQSQSKFFAIVYSFHLIGIFTIPILLRKNIDFIEDLQNTILYYSIINCFFIILFSFYSPGFLPIWVTQNGYAFLYQPYLFAIFIGFSILTLVYKNTVLSKIALIFLVAFLLQSNSRIIIIAILVLIMFVASRRTIIFLIFSVFCISIVFPPMKLLTLLGSYSSNAQSLSSDGSWLMRYTTFMNFYEWLNLKLLLLGKGYRAFEEFSFPYGEPGPPDMLFVRIISEIGILGLIFMMSGFIYIATSGYHNKFNVIVFTSTIFLMSSVQESWYAAGSGHVLSILFVAFGVFANKNRKSYLNELDKKHAI